jgi:hypothetical protein
VTRQRGRVEPEDGAALRLTAEAAGDLREELRRPDRMARA